MVVTSSYTYDVIMTLYSAISQTIYSIQVKHNKFIRECRVK